MNFILYLIVGLIEVFGVMVGISSDRPEMLPVGLITLFGICVIFWICVIIMTKTKLNKKLAFALSIVITIIVIAGFCGICILIEFMSN